MGPAARAAALVVVAMSNKFKKTCRARAKRTGESYTAARRLLLDPDEYAKEKARQTTLRKRP